MYKVSIVWKDDHVEALSSESVQNGSGGGTFHLEVSVQKVGRNTDAQGLDYPVAGPLRRVSISVHCVPFHLFS